MLLYYYINIKSTRQGIFHMKSKDIIKIVLLLLLNSALAFTAFYIINQDREKSHETPEPLTPLYTETVSQSEPEASPVVKEEALPQKEAEQLILSAYSEYLVIGKTMKIDAAVSPADAEISGILWESENNEIAKVNPDGTVEAVSRGFTYIKAYTDNGVFALQPIYVMKPGLVFLSPSRQLGNFYYKSKISECKQAFIMSGFCKKRLETVGLDVYECPTKYILEDRGKLAAKKKAKCYVAIHTNAGGNDTGTMVFYNRKSGKAMRLALCLYDTVAPVTPDKDAGIRNGVEYKECKYPYQAGVPSVLLEVDFHDKKESAQWLLDNGELCGNVIADGIMRFMYEMY